jgi:riboflavin kinase / FMN adenylyltransferase
MPSADEPNVPARAFAVCRDGEPVPASLRRAVVAIGNFDGVHRGHRALIDIAIAEVRERNAPAAVLTFEPHPRKFFAPDKPLFRLTPEPAKLVIFRKLGLDGAFVRRFDAGLAATTATDFVDRLLGRELGVSGVVVGHDFHFGKERAGTPALLEELCQRNGWLCVIVPPVTFGGKAVSSGAVRAALEAGDVARANALLGHRWFVEGEVRHGDKRGRALGFPTANISLPDDCGLRHGIYAVRAALAPGEVCEGVASFGRRPTFDNGAPLLEPFLFDFAGDLYGRTLQAEFVGWIRGEERFESAEALVERMNKDACIARAMLAEASDNAFQSMIG